MIHCARAQPTASAGEREIEQAGIHRRRRRSSEAHLNGKVNANRLGRGVKDVLAGQEALNGLGYRHAQKIARVVQARIVGSQVDRIEMSGDPANAGVLVVYGRAPITAGIGLDVQYGLLPQMDRPPDRYGCPNERARIRARDRVQCVEDAGELIFHAVPGFLQRF